MTNPTRTQVDVVIAAIEQDELDLDARTKARTVIYGRERQGFEINNPRLLRIGLLCLAVAGVLAWMVLR